MLPPIIIAAFGTSSKARTDYEQADAYLKTLFPGHEIHWAYTSRIVRQHMQKRGIAMSPPADVVAAVAAQGYSWAVVQSFNMICGHEFYRLVDESRNAGCRVSIGHSLLCSPEDHQAVAQALGPLFARDEREAVVLVGHGTDHCIWTAYAAFYQRIREIYGRRAFGSMIEAEGVDRETVIQNVQAQGFKQVRLVPFMLVAGVHFEEDLAGSEDSWKAACEARGLQVSLERQGLASRSEIIEIFGRHIRSALAVIPGI